jgi:hypothetical protein
VVLENWDPSLAVIVTVQSKIHRSWPTGAIVIVYVGRVSWLNLRSLEVKGRTNVFVDGGG